ncbi:hypothetical protein DV735_g5930, partial [Chaetothyriales sp. CBS 134920]
MATTTITTIRQATLSDVEQIAQVFAAGFIDDDVFGRFMHPRRREYPLDWLAHWQREIRLHVLDPSVVTYAMAAFERNWEDIKHHFVGARAQSWMIEMLCVAPDAQGRGHGRALVEAAIARCRGAEGGDGRVPLCVIASERGDAFYDKLGFREVGRANVGELSGVSGGSLKQDA